MLKYMQNKTLRRFQKRFSPSFHGCKFLLYGVQRDVFFFICMPFASRSHLCIKKEYEVDPHGRLTLCYVGGFTFGGFKGYSSHSAFSMQACIMVFSIVAFNFSMLFFSQALGCIHSKMSHTQLLCFFQKGKDLKLEIEMACNHCTNLWFNHIFDLYNIFL